MLNFAEKNRVELEKALKMTITISGFSELLHDQSPNTQKRGVLPFQHDSESYGDPEKSWVDMADRQINVFLFFFCTIASGLTRVPFVKKSSHCGSPIHSFVLVETTNIFLDFSINLQSILALDVLLSRIQSFFLH